MGFLNQLELEKLGFKRLGNNVRVSEKASLYNVSHISLGNNVRIDDFCVVSAGPGGIVLGNHVHLAPFCVLIGQENISMADFSGLSSRVSIYSSTDDYSGDTMTNPTVPDEYKNVTHGPVQLQKHVIIGAGAVILPGVCISEGAAVGALSLVNSAVAPFTIVAGTPALYLKNRSRRLLEIEAKL